MKKLSRARKNAGRAPTLGAESIPGLEPEKPMRTAPPKKTSEEIFKEACPGFTTSNKTFQEEIKEEMEWLEADREARWATTAAAAASPLPEGWVETWNLNSGQTLYVHYQLKIVTDERPAKEPAEQPAKQPVKRASNNKALGNNTRAKYQEAQWQQAV